MREGFARADGVRIHFVDHAGAGPPLLLVHATGFHARLWDPFVPALGERFRVIAIDQRGHGDSDKPASGYEWRNFGLDVLAVARHLGLDAPAGMGHSSGATALVLGEAGAAGTFSRLVLMDPVTPPSEISDFFAGERNPMSSTARRRRSVWDSPAAMLERMRDGTPMTTWREEFRRAYVEHALSRGEDGRFELKCPPQIEAQVYENAGTHDGWERMWELGCPVLLMVGEHSHMWRGRTRAPRHGRVETVPGCGHFFPMEDPEATLQRALPFLVQGT